MAKKGKKGLVIALAVLLPILIAGGVAGAAFMGFVKIPGLNLGKANLYGDNALYGDDDPTPPEPPEPKTPPKPRPAPEPKPKTPPLPPEPERDPALGAKKLAGIWNNMTPAQIVRLAEEYDDLELARVLSMMEAEITAEVLATLPDPRRAARLSREIERLASLVPPTP